MNPSITIIANPASGGASERKLRRAVSLLVSRGAEVNVLVTTKRGDATNYARETVKRRADIIIAAGGDGTVNEVANGMAGSTVPLALLPLGTANVLAGELGVPLDVEGAVEAAMSKEPNTVALGMLETSGRSRYFTFSAGAGFDGEVVRRLNDALRKSLGKAAYAVSWLQALAFWTPTELLVTADGAAYKCRSLIAGRTRIYAGNCVVSPNADFRKPVLHLTMLHNMRRADILRHTFAMFRQRLPGSSGVTQTECTRLTVEGIAPIQADGDFFGATPAIITVRPSALRLIF